MVSVIESIKNVYRGSNVLKVHLILAVLATISQIALGGYFSEYINALLPVPLVIILAIVLYIAYAIYYGGFQLQYLHNNFIDDKESKLPDWGLSQFATGFKAVKLYIVCFVYVLITNIAILTLLLLVLFVAGGLILWVIKGSVSALISPKDLFLTGATIASTISFIAAYIGCLLYCIFWAFVWAVYSENYVDSGLYNILLPFKFMRKYFKDTLVLILKFIPICVLAFLPLIPIFIRQQHVLADIPGIAVASYLLAVSSLAFWGSIVQLYREKRAES
jgi:hypothetical protein